MPKNTNNSINNSVKIAKIDPKPIKNHQSINKNYQKSDQERFRQRHGYKAVSETQKEQWIFLQIDDSDAIWPISDTILGPAGSRRGHVIEHHVVKMMNEGCPKTRPEKNWNIDRNFI